MKMYSKIKHKYLRYIHIHSMGRLEGNTTMKRRYLYSMRRKYP
jgi:hypothetical protein